MPDYTQQRDFSAKDALESGNSDKVAKGADIDDELARIATAIAFKFDTDDTLLTEINVMTQDPGFDSLMMWDESANNTVWAKSATNGGIAFVAETIKIDLNDLAVETGMASGDFIAMVDITDSASTKITLANFEAIVDHDALSNFVAGEHILHSGVNMIAGTGLTGGGTIDATRTFNVIGGDGITANANDIAITNVAAGVAQPVVITAGTYTFDLSSITELTIPNFSQSADKILVSDAGTLKVMPYDESGIKVASVSGTTDTLAATDMNTFIEYTNGAAVAVTLNNSVGVVGNILVIKQTGAGQVTVGGTATLQSAVGNKTRAVDSVLTLVCLVSGGSAEWALYGDQAA